MLMNWYILNIKQRRWMDGVTRSKVTDRVGDTAPFDFFDDGGQPPTVDPLAADHLQTEDGCRRRV